MRLQVDIGKKYPQITGPIADAFADELNNIVKTGEFSELVLDFNGTQVLSSMAMGALFTTYQKLKDQSKTLQVTNASPKVTHLLRMVNMGDILG